MSNFTASLDAGDYQKLAPVYESLHPGRGIEVDFYLSLVDDRVSSILDLGCGTGGLTIPLEAKRNARHGSRGRTVGIDSSSAMLGLGRPKAPTILWIEGDMRSPAVLGPFDLIICGLNTIQHLLNDEDVLATFECVRRLLGRGGIFAFDIFNPDPAFLQPLREDVLVRRVRGPEGPFELRESTKYQEDTRILTISWHLPPIEGGLGETALFRMRQYWPSDMRALLDRAGLTVLDLFGDFNRSELSATAPRQIYRCTAAP